MAKRKKTKSRAGTGTVGKRGDGAWRLRYRIGGRRFAQTVHVETSLDSHGTEFA